MWDFGNSSRFPPISCGAARLRPPFPQGDLDGFIFHCTSLRTGIPGGRNRAAVDHRAWQRAPRQGRTEVSAGPRRKAAPSRPALRIVRPDGARERARQLTAFGGTGTPCARRAHRAHRLGEQGVREPVRRVLQQRLVLFRRRRRPEAREVRAALRPYAQAGIGGRGEARYRPEEDEGATLLDLLPSGHGFTSACKLQR